MGVSKIGEYTPKNFGALASASVARGADDLFLDVEDFTEKIVMGSPGATTPLSHGPLVRNNLMLFRASDNFAYTLGLDYLEDAEGGVVNIRIPAGEGVRAEYFYHTQGAIGTGLSGVYAPGPKSEVEDTSDTVPAPSPGMRFATVLKMGV